MELNKIKTDTIWGEAAADVNNNFQRVGIELDKFKDVTLRNKGYFSSESVLREKHPYPQVGDTAWVGSPFPGYVYKCETIGVWTATTDKPDTGEINMEGFAKKEDLEGKADKENSEGKKVAYSSDGKAITPSELASALKNKADGLYVDDENRLWLKSGNDFIGTGIELPEGGGTGLLNISQQTEKYDYASSQLARNAALDEDRFKGQVITYQLYSGEWVLDMFIGESVSSWGNEGSWKSFITQADLQQIVTDIQSIKGEVQALKNEVANKIDGGYVVDDKFLQFTNNGEDVGDPIELPAGGGGGGGSGITIRVRIIGQQTLTVGEGTDVLIKYNFSSIESDTGDDTGDGTYVVTVNGATIASGTAVQGENAYNLKGHIFLGQNTIRVRVTDSYNNVKTVTWNVQVATLTLTSTFADDNIYISNPVPFRYTPVGIGEKTIRFILDGKELTPDVTESSGKQMTKSLTGLTNGSHSLRVYAESTITGSTLKSNELYYEFIYADASETRPIIALSYNKSEVEQFSTIEIPFVVFNPVSPTANVSIRVNNELVEQLTVPRTKQRFTYQANVEGELRITFTVGAVTKALTIQVKESGYEIREETGDLEYKAFAVGKSNSSTERDKWDYNNHLATFTGFAWADDGWQKDEEGNNCLRLIGDSKLSIDIKPFSNDVLITGSTLTIEYSTQTVTKDEAVIITSMFAGIGIEFTPTSVTLKSAQSKLTARFDSSQKISVSLVIEKLAENRLAYLFVDGIASGTLQYPQSDNFTQNTQTPFTFSTGGRSCQLQVYGLRWYKNSLNFDQILGNYIFDIENLEEKMDVYLRNQITNEYGNIDYNKALDFLPCMTIIGDLPNYKGDKKPADIIYESRQAPLTSFTAQAATNDVQGTSSQFYPRKNYKIKFKNFIITETGEILSKYELGGDGIPALVFCLKADFAESSGTHNTGIAVMVDQMLKDYGILTPPQKKNPKVRTAIYGFPILVFHKQTASSQAEFVGKYNFNYDKAAEEVFDFQAGNECWEFKNNTSKICLFKSADFTKWDDDLEARYPDGGEDTSNVQKVFAWVVSCIGNPEKFKAECAEHFDIPNLLFYYIITETLVMTDQRAKNQFITTYGEKGSTGELIWRFIFYDNDTALGINNEGRIAFNPYVEDMDKVDSGYVWNGWDSEIWRLVKAAFPDEIKTMYQQLRQKQILSLAATTKALQEKQADKWCELVYNQDGQYKYVDPLVNGYYDYSSGSPVLVKTGSFLYALQGSRTRHRGWYLNERFNYTDSKYDAGSHINDYASMRLYTPATWGGVAPNPHFKITMSKTGYIRILFGSVKTDGVRALPNTTYTINAPTGVQLNDTETVIYGISAIKSLGDLSGKYVGTVDISKAYALEDLLLGSTVAKYVNENLSNLSTGANGKLKKVNVAGCPNLIQSLDFSLCYSLEEVEARNSGITGISLPNSGVLKKLYLPASFAALILKNQPDLDTVTFQGYTNLNTIIIDNVPKIDGYTLVKNCVNLAGNKLSKVRLINIDAADNTTSVLNAISQMTGVDDNGLPTEVAIVTGKIHINQITEGAFERLSATFPNLKITYTTLLEVIDFEDNTVKEIMVAKFDTNGDGELSPYELLTKAVPAGILTDTGAKSFNEMHYWGGTGSELTESDTIKSASLLTGRAIFRHLPALETVRIYQGQDESMDATPLLYSQQSLTNCYNINKWILSGRYVENSKRGLIMGKANSNNGTYYRACYPMKGYTSIEVDEPCSWDDNNETTYGHGRLIKTITLNAMTDAVFGNSELLETVNIHGIGWNSTGRIYIRPNKRSLTYINADGSKNPGAIGNITSAYPNYNPLYIKIGEGLTSTPTKSYVDVFCTGGNTLTQRSIITELDLGTGINSTIRYSTYRNWDNSVWCGIIEKLIIRNPNAILPLVQTGEHYPNVWKPFSVVYVPDELVDAYKTATLWSRYAGLIKPLSLLTQ